MAKQLSDVTMALLETAKDLHGGGLLSDDTYRKITLRHLGPDAPSTAAPISAERRCDLKER